MQSLLELLQREHAEAEHLAALGALGGRLPQCLQHVPQCYTEGDAANELLLDKQSEEYTRDAQFLLGVLGEEPILVKEVVDHAGEDVVLAGIPRGLKRLEHLDDLARRVL